MTRSVFFAAMVAAIKTAQVGLVVVPREQFFPNGDRTPHVSYLEVSDTPLNTSAGEAATNMRIQIDVWHPESKAAAEVLADLVNEKLRPLFFRRVFSRASLESSSKPNGGNWGRVQTDWVTSRQTR